MINPQMMTRVTMVAFVTMDDIKTILVPYNRWSHGQNASKLEVVHRENLDRLEV